MSQETMTIPAPANAQRPAGACRALALGGLLVLLVGFAFAPAFQAQFIWDDDLHILENVHLRSLHGLEQIWFNLFAFHQYYPLAQTSWWIEYHLWGTWPAGYHAVNLAIHAANALLLFGLLRRLKVPGAWWAAALFALHPMQVETAAWVMERKNLLSGFFYLLAFHAFVRFLRLDDGDRRPARKAMAWIYAAGVACFACALLAKSVAGTLPAAVLLVTWWKRGRIGGREWLSMLALLPLSIVSAGITGYMEVTQVGAHGPDWDFSLVQRFLIAGRVLWHYLGKLVWPHPLMFFYPRWHVDAGQPWQYLFPVGFLALVGVLWGYRELIGRGSLTAVLFFAGTLVPALGFANVYPMRFSFVADHFQYMACIGPLTLIAALVTRATRQGAGVVPARVGLAAGVAAIGVLGGLTFQRCRIFYDGFTLYSDVVAKDPTSMAGLNLLAAEYMDRRDFQRAVTEYRTALRLYPEEVNNREGLGNALLAAGQAEEARELLQKVVERRPGSASAWNDLAGAYVVLNRREEAARMYLRAIELEPGYAPAHYNLGGVLAHARQFAAAAREFRAAAEAWSAGDLGGGQTATGEGLPDAIFKEGLCLAEQGQVEGALGCFEEALKLRPGWPEAQDAVSRARAALRP